MIVNAKNATTKQAVDVTLSNTATVGDLAGKLAEEEKCQLSSVVLIVSGKIQKQPTALITTMGPVSDGKIFVVYMAKKKKSSAPTVTKRSDSEDKERHGHLKDMLTQALSGLEWTELTKNVLEAVEKASPNHLDRRPRDYHVGFQTADFIDPVAIHPIFYGCYDWHSAVHSHWTLCVLLDRTHDIDLRDKIIASLDRRFTAENVAREVATIDVLPSGWEAPYGLSWFTKLYSQLISASTVCGDEGVVTSTACGDEGATDGVVARKKKEWRDLLTPLAIKVIDRLLQWVTTLATPDRSGWHGNTAFSLLLVLESCDAEATDSQLRALQKPCKVAVLGFYEHDLLLVDKHEQCPFLSPTLCECELLSHCTNAEEGVVDERVCVDFREWLPKGVDASVWAMRPNEQGDPRDGYKSHLCGLNLSRARSLAAVVSCLLNLPGDRHPQIDLLTTSARDHFSRAVPDLASGHFMGDHWLTSFALRAADGLQSLINTLECPETSKV